MTKFDPDLMDPVAERAERNRLGSWLAQKALAECPSIKFVAASLGVQVWHLYKCQDPGSKHQLNLSEIIGLAPAPLRVIVEQLADQLGCDVVDRGDSITSATDYRSLSDTLRACANAVAAFGDAITDAHITPDEAVKIVFECKGAIARLHGIVERAKQAIKERGIPVRGAA